MIIDDVYKLVMQLASKYGAGGYFSPEEFNRYALLAQEQKLEDEIKSMRNTKRSDIISSFIAHNVPMTVVEGIAVKPDDYRQYESAFYNDFSTGIAIPAAFEELTNDEWNFRIGSELDRPSLDFPALVIRDTSIEVAPASMGFFSMTYIIDVEDPKWNWITPVTSRYQFDEATSVDFNYDQSEIPDLTFRILKLGGIEIRDNQVYQQAASEQQQTK